MKQPIKIAYIIDTIETRLAGTEKQLFMLMEEIDKSKFRPYLICLQNSNWLQNNTVPVELHVLEVNSLMSINFFKGLVKLRKFVRREKIDIIQTFFKDANLLGTFAAKLSNVKIVISSRRNLGEYWHTFIWIFILKLLRFWTTIYVSNSQAVADYTITAEKINKNKIITIYNGLELDKFNRISPQLRETTRRKLAVGNSDVLVGLVANWRPVKNIPLFIRVASRFKDEFPWVKFIVIGKPPTKEELSNFLTEQNITGNVSFLGVIADIIPYLSAMDIGVLCSRAESLSNSITEYLAAGLPCVVSKVGGNAEAIGYGTGGFVFENDNFDDFYVKLKGLILDSAQRVSLGERVREFVRQQYDHRKMIMAYEKLYTGLMIKEKSGKSNEGK